MNDDYPDALAQAAAAWKLREDGATVREVADALGCSVGTAHNRLKLAADAERVARDVDDRRAGRVREVTALDAWQDVAERQYAAEPDPAWLRALVALSARRARLLGLDAPARIHLADDRPDPQPDPELSAAIDALREGNRAARDGARSGTGDDGRQGTDAGERAR